MKKIALLVVGLFVVLAIGLLAAPYFIPGTALKAPLIARLESMTGRKLTIDGPFTFRLFPTASVHMEDVTLSNPSNCQTVLPFIKLKSLNVSVALIPLLSDKVNIKSLSLQDPQINLHVNSTGINNWQFSPPAGVQPPAGAASPKGAGASILPRDLLLSGVEIKNGDVTYVNELTKQRWEVKNLNGEISLSGIASPFSLDGEGSWNGKTVSLKARLDSLQSFMTHARTAVDASINSELLSIETHGAIDRGVYYTGKAGVKSSSLKTVMAWVNPGAKPLATPAPLKLSVTGDAECSPNYCNLSKVNLALDGLKAEGSIRVNQGPERPNINIDLSTGKLDFNPFLPPEQHTANSFNPLLHDAAAAAPAGGWSTEPMDFSALRRFDMIANVKTDGITLRHLTTGKAMLQAKLQHAQLSADIVNADMYGGKGDVTVNVDDSGPVPLLETRAVLKGIQLEPLMKDAAGIDRFSGKADIDVSTAAYGHSQKELVTGLSGRGVVKVTGGAITGINIDSMVHNVQAAFAGGSNQKTVFTDMSGSFMITQGIASNQDLLINSATLHVSGKGQVNLPLQTIHYVLTPQMMRAAGTAKSAPKEGLGVPVIVEGSLDHPTYRPDLAAVAREAISNPKQFKSQLKNSENNLKDQLKGLKGLLKNKKN